MPDHQAASTNLQFLKLGGSLITDKTRPRSLRSDVLARLAAEIAAVWGQDPTQRLVLGHGAGSFGHVPAKKYDTRQGVHSSSQWSGFVEVWQEAAALDHLVVEALHGTGLPAIALHPSGSVLAKDGKVATWDLAPLRSALQAGLLPVIHGDVIFDITRGGTILSTEDLFDYLAHQLKPQRILLAGLETGVWEDYPDCTRLIPEINPSNLNTIEPALGESAAVDVTGGMASKVHEMLALAEDIPGLEVLIFSGEIPGLITLTLRGDRAGTLIRGSVE